MNRSVQRELAEKHQIRNVPPLDYALRGQDAERDRQIERRAHFAHIGRRQVHGDAMRGKLEAGIADGAPDAVAAFANARVGQADHLEAWHPERHVNLDVYGAGLDAKQRGGAQPGKHPREQVQMATREQRSNDFNNLAGLAEPGLSDSAMRARARMCRH